MSRILRLAQLAPDIAEDRLDDVGRRSATSPAAELSRRIGCLPVPCFALPRSHVTEGMPGLVAHGRAYSRAGRRGMVIPANGVFFGLWHAKDISAKIETGRREARPMDLKEPRIWYAVIIVLIIIGYATGWFGGEPAVVPQQ